MKSWKKYLPNYKIIEWNDKNLKNCNNAYVQEAYKAGKYAFVSDYFRLYALYKYGGVYLDTDNEVFKSFDEFLNLDFFTGYENWEGEYFPFTAVVGAKKGIKIIKDLLDEYNDLHFINPDGSYNMYTNTRRVSNYFERTYHFYPPHDGTKPKILEDKCIIYPSNIFCNYEENVSYAVHHFSGSWLPEKTNNKSSISKFSLKNIFSVYNRESHKVWNIFGIKIKFKNYKKLYKQLDIELIETKNKLNNTKKQLEYLKEHSDITKLKPATGELREQQLKLVEFAKDFFEEIKELDIKPFLIAGNLIGHVRHNGFVPWDDDIDFGLIRADYNKLIDFCIKNLNVEIFDNSIYEYKEKQFKKYLCEKYPNEFVLTIWHDQLQVFKGTDSGDFNYLDFFAFDYYDDNYSFDEYKIYLNEIKKKKKKKHTYNHNNPNRNHAPAFL